MRDPSRLLGSLVLALLLTTVLPSAAAAVSGPPAQRDSVLMAADAMPAIDLRVTLGRLLGEHAYLLMEAIGVDDGAEREIFEAALVENSDALRAAVATIYGENAGGRFVDLWDRHIELLLDYGNATRAGDTGAQRTALEGLDDYIADLGMLLAELNPGLDPVQEADALRAHIDQTVAFAQGDFADSYASRRMAFSHMFELGDHLALEIVRQFPGQFPGGPVAFSPRSDLQLALDQLLSEHMVLAAEAMRAGVTKSPEFEAASASLDENTQDLSDAIAGVYGADAGTQFQDVWREHTAAYLAFVQALGANDDAARRASLEQLHAYHERIAQFLTSSNPMLDAAAVADLIRRHVQALITQAEATAANDPARAVAATREGYAGTFEVGAALADAIARQFPDQFRDLEQLPMTDVGVEAAPEGYSGVLLAALVLTAALWLLPISRRRARRSARLPIHR
jgi:hypothetical protein